MKWLKHLWSAPQSPAPWAPTHQHRKGGLYRVIGPAILEADHSDVVIYDDADGTTWVRSKAEFYDGRFAALSGPRQG